MMRILYIHSTLVPPPSDQKKDRFLLLSKDLEGDVLQPVWFSTKEEIEAIFGPGSYPVYTVGRFRYHLFPAYNGNRVRNRFATFWFYLRTGFRVYRERGIDCIVVYSHLTTALCGVVLKILTGTRLITEVMTAPDKIYFVDRPRPSLWDRIRHVYSDISLHIAVLSSDRVHLLFAGALASYPLLRNRPSSVFHDYTPLSAIRPEIEKDDNRPCILLAGYPWYLKGVDIAVEAFRRLAADYPLAKLQIVVHAPDGVPQKLAAGCFGIEVLKAMPHDDLMQLVSRAAIVLLPSRNEGLGRILMEGMAARLPLVGSNVGGIPTLIHHGENGFLFPVGDVAELEKFLRLLLSDVSLRRQMGQRSYELLQATLTEEAYAEQFVKMVRDVVSAHHSRQSGRGTS